MTLTRPLIALAALLIGIALPAGIARAGQVWPEDATGEERPSDLPPWLIASRLVRPADDGTGEDGVGPGGLSDLGAVLLREAPAVLEADPLTLRTSTGDDSGDLRTILGTGERWHLMRFGAAAGSRPQDATVTAYGTVAYLPSTVVGSRADAGLGFGPAAAPSLGISDQDEPISLGFKAQLDGLEGGAEYRSIGKRMEPVVAGPVSQRDREGTEVWVAQRLGLLRLKLSQSDLSDNVDRDPALPRTRKVQTAITTQLTPRGWPLLGLTYATGDSERTWFASGGRPRVVERQSFDSVAGSAYYASGFGDVSGSSTYVYSRDPGASDRGMTSLYHDLTLNLRPISSITVSPSVGSGLDHYQWSDVRNQTGAASLLLSYTPAAAWWSLWTLGSYTTAQASDRTVDGRTMTVSGGLVFGLGRALGGRTSLSVEAGYDSYEDAIYPDASSRGAFGLVLLKVTSF